MEQKATAKPVGNARKSQWECRWWQISTKLQEEHQLDK